MTWQSCFMLCCARTIVWLDLVCLLFWRGFRIYSTFLCTTVWTFNITTLCSWSGHEHLLSKCLVRVHIPPGSPSRAFSWRIVTDRWVRANFSQLCLSLWMTVYFSGPRGLLYNKISVTLMEFLHENRTCIPIWNRPLHAPPTKLFFHKNGFEHCSC